MITDFPSSPSPGDEYVSPAGITYVFDDKGRWVIVYAASDQWIDRTSDTMLGPLTLAGEPTADLHAVPKQYVDGIAGPTSTAMRHIIANQGFLSWDFELQDAAGNPDPADPTLPDQITYINQADSQMGVRVVLVRSAGKLVSQQVLYTIDGGANWVEAGNATDPLAKLTFTYSARAGFEDVIIGGVWT